MIEKVIIFFVCIHLGDIQKRQWETGKFAVAFWRGQSTPPQSNVFGPSKPVSSF